MVYYTVPGGKLNRGLTVVHSLQSLNGSEPLSDEQLHKAHVLGWCIEWVRQPKGGAGVPQCDIV